jgi:hypothetical protein
MLFCGVAILFVGSTSLPFQTTLLVSSVASPAWVANMGEYSNEGDEGDHGDGGLVAGASSAMSREFTRQNLGPCFMLGQVRGWRMGIRCVQLSSNVGWSSVGVAD